MLTVFISGKNFNLYYSKIDFGAIGRTFKTSLLFLQVNSLQQKKSEVSASPATTKELSEKFVCTQFSEQDYLRAMQLMDLVTLDIGSLAYKYSVLAASVIYHCHDEASALASSGNFTFRFQEFSFCCFNICKIIECFVVIIGRNRRI